MSTNKIATAAPEPESFDEVMRNLQRSIAAVVDSPALSMTRAVAQMVDDMAKSRQEMFRSIAESVPRIVFPSTTLYLTRLPRSDAASKVKLVGSSDLLTAEPTSQAKELAKRKSERKKTAFGLYLLACNCVENKRKILKAFSIETQHGRLLKMFLEADGHFVAYDELLKAFNKLVISDVGFILRNLKNVFRENHLKIIIESRPKSKGYVLVDIQEITPKTD